MNIAFIDFEASGLMPGSYPIEVGWGGPDIPIEEYLIQPTEDWIGRSELWSEEAQKFHNISQQTIASDGMSVYFIANKILTELKDVQLYSDNADIDQAWLARLFDAAETQLQHRILDLQELLHQYTNDEGVKKAYRQAVQMTSAKQRSARNVNFMIQVFKNCCDGDKKPAMRRIR
ncbi:MAG: hypothetical protein HKM24_01350 [Gammaproteobacteria bacterium]|nr:hypothetical protein [Gammaproteobacteria bacterium]